LGFAQAQIVPPNPQKLSINAAGTASKNNPK
jgi:hypothetical protein